MVNAMIEPYATAVNSALTEFSRIGFSKAQDSDYSVAFSNGRTVIEIATEKHYHPSLSTRLVDEYGRKYSIRIVREILSPDQLKKDSADLEALKKRYKIDDPNADRKLQEEGVAAYVTLAIEQLLFFLSSNRVELFSDVDTYRSEYAIREKSALKSLGI